jgi:hypothetical protein
MMAQTAPQEKGKSEQDSQLLHLLAAPARTRIRGNGRDLYSQPTMSRLENAPGLKDVVRLTYALVDQWMASYETVPSSVTLHMADTCDVAHGHQHLSLFDAHYDERCFLPIHAMTPRRAAPLRSS